MAKQNGKDVSAKLVDAWQAPIEGGDPFGCVATTFTFSPAFFEEDCLCRFLNMQTDPAEDGAAYLIEREEKMASLRCAAVLADTEHCRGIRSLRWDLLSARVPSGILHAKISLLQWTNQVRLIVSSGNLTEEGYRKNQEVFGILDYHEGSNAPIACLREITAFLGEAVGYAGTPSKVTKRWLSFLEGVNVTASDWGITADYSGKKTLRVHPVLTGPGRKSSFEQLANYWPEGVRPSEAIVTSPFFDKPGSPNMPAIKMWELLRARGAAKVTFNVVADEVEPSGTLLLRAPEELKHATPSQRQSTKTVIRLLKENTDGKNIRPLHMKSIFLEGADWVAYLIGSGNFTTAGLGLGHRRNLEANLLYLTSSSGNLKAEKSLRLALPNGAPVPKGCDLRWVVADPAGLDETSPDHIPLPPFFDQAIYRSIEGKAAVALTFTENAPSGWRLNCEDIADSCFLDEETWKQKGRPKEALLDWPRLLPPSGFHVSWGAGFKSWLPVNLEQALSLPPPAELRDLPLEILLRALTSALPLHVILANHLRKKKTGSDEKPEQAIDPHKKVDTSAFLLQRTRQVGAALRGLKERLERPVPSKEALDWRLRGPVGVSALAKAMSEAAKSEEERCFLLTELYLELSRVIPGSAPGFVPPGEVHSELQTMGLELAELATRKVKTLDPSMRKYVHAAFKELNR